MTTTGPARIKDRYVEMLGPLLAIGKPVVGTEFGNPSCVGGDEMSALSTASNIDGVSLLLHFRTRPVRAAAGREGRPAG